MRKNDIEAAFDLYRKLLEVVDREKEEISKANLEGVEDCGRLKTGLMKQLSEIDVAASVKLDPDRGQELENIIKQVIEINKSNSLSVSQMKDSIVEEISGLHKGKKAVKAYGNKMKNDQ